MPELNPVDIEERICRTSNQIAQGVNVLDKTYRAFLAADRDFDAAWANAIIHALGNNAEIRKAEATLATLGQREARDDADATYRYSRNRADALDNELRAWQSVGASIRMQYSVAGRGEQ